MVDSTQANWNAIKIVYDFGDPSINMVDKERTCLFHWGHSLDKHIKQLIKLELQDEHTALCHQYKNVKSLGDPNSHYAFIRSWWLSSGDVSKVGVHELNNWLSFWHFCVKQW
jgi:hypothetical protein